MQFTTDNNWGYPTEESFGHRPAATAPSVQTAEPETRRRRRPTQTYQASFQFNSNLRLLALFIISAATAALVIFPMREQAIRFISRLSSEPAYQIQRSQSLPSASQFVQDSSSRRAMLYRCGKTWKSSPARDEECSAVEAIVIRDDHGNQFITQTW